MGESENAIRFEEVSRTVIGAALRIHRELGPGLLESVYEALLANSLGRQGLQVLRQQPVFSRQLLTYLRLMNLPVGLLINFGGVTLKEGLRRVINSHAIADLADPPPAPLPPLLPPPLSPPPHLRCFAPSRKKS